MTMIISEKLPYGSNIRCLACGGLNFRPDRILRVDGRRDIPGAITNTSLLECGLCPATMVFMPIKTEAGMFEIFMTDISVKEYPNLDLSPVDEDEVIEAHRLFGLPGEAYIDEILKTI